MKKTFIALAVAAVAATSANAAVVYEKEGTKVEVGGSVRLLVTQKNGDSTDLTDDGSRVTVQATHDLGNGLSALGYGEFGLKDNLNTRKAYVGFEHKDIGTLTFGNQATTSDELGLADPTVKFGGFEHTVFQDEGKKVVKFKSQKLDNGLSFGASYVFNNTATRTLFDDSSYIVAAFYENKFGDVDAKGNVGYVYKDGAHEAQVSAGAEFSNVSLGVDYALNKNKGSNKLAHKVQLGASFKFNDDTKAYTAARYLTADKTVGFAVGVKHNLHKQVETFVEYNGEKKDKAKLENTVYAGLRVSF